jgi:4-alpha-glucanotransferase
MTLSVQSLAERHGISPFYPGPNGDILVPERTQLHFLKAMGVEHDAQVEMPNRGLATSPAQQRMCHFPEWLRERRAWGIAAQLYELRSERNWGIGDFADLAVLCEIAAEAGADFIGLNPLHALFLAEPRRCSPFSPSNRQFLNPLYIAVDRIEGFDGEIDENEVRRLRDKDLVDYDAVTRLKLDALARMWPRRAGADREALQTFTSQGGAALRNHATFEALSARMTAAGKGSGWKGWPGEYASPDKPAVHAFSEEHANQIEFHIWLQWLARKQLSEAAERARRADMRIGLYLDFAVGEAPDGSATWGSSGLAVSGVKIGAPPDVFSAGGQDWGLTPLSPARLARDDFQSYSTLMAAAMQDAGALRIDHAMSLRQLFWIPEGGTPAEGGFVLYPMNGMLHALAEASQNNGTVVIGEDLGHVPEGFREAMADAGIFSYRILYFERSAMRFTAPAAWPALSLACLSTHDLPTLKGWWSGGDIALRLEHGLIDDEAAALQSRMRKRERRELLRSMASDAVLPRRVSRSFANTAKIEGHAYEVLAAATHRFIARTRSRLACARLADAVGEEQPTNLPGTSDSYPNWQRKLPVPLEDIGSLSSFHAIAAVLNKERPR